MHPFIAVLVGAFLVASPAFAADAETTMPRLVITDVVAADVPTQPPAPNFSTRVEANPVMKTVTKSPIAFVALKATVAATSIMAAEKMWKSGNRTGAVGAGAVAQGG